MSFFVQSAYAQNTAPPATVSPLFNLIFIFGTIAIIYFIAIRPQRKRQKEHAELVASLGKGDEVITNSGILGKVVGLNDNYIVLNVSNNVDLKFQRFHIHAVLPKGTLKSIET